MRSPLRLTRRAALSVVLASLPLFASGCADERAPISRVQANALAKSFFVGALDDPSDDPEFYQRVTVVDAQSGAGNDGLYTSSDAQPTARVRFEVTEKLLVARLTYELVDDTDHHGLRRTPDGQIVAAYTIDKHFDIRRDYNASTGEESNVVVENDSERTWNQREYMRVDWSKNLITDAYDLDALSQLGIFYGVKIDPVAYYVNDPAHPDAPRFDLDRGYFDVTTKALASPEIIHDAEWGDFPACWLVGEFPTLSCNPSELTLRQSYLRVVDHDYEPVDWDGTKMDMFGYFTADRFGYDRRYGVVDDKWHRFATRWNVWERSHALPLVACGTKETTPIGKNVHRDDDGDGTEDECASVGRGSRCDEFRAECTIPLRDRKVRTIPWHVSPGFPEELYAGTKQALDAWNHALRVAVVSGRMSECRRTGAEGCEAELRWPAVWADDYVPPVGSNGAGEVPNVFVLCHNPVDPAKGDDAACGAVGTAARLGDLRYNFVNITDAPQQRSPWGIMVDAEDPLTGEKIAGSVNEWGAVLDRAASTLADLLALIDGDIAPDAYIAGQNVSDWVRAQQPGGPAERGGAPMTAADVASRRGAFDPQAVAPYASGLPAAKPGTPPQARHRAKVQALVDQGRLGPGNAALMQRMTKLRGTALEATLVSPEMAQAAGFDPSASLGADARRRGSPFFRMNPAVRRLEERSARVGRAKRHACRVESPEPDNLLGLARAARKLFPAPDPTDRAAVEQHREQVYLWARQEYNKGVMAHEMGHSMGLRHNFAASFDALNYEPQYWQLRTSNGTVTKACADGTEDGAACVGPRWRDPLSKAEIEGDLGKYATSSVMDYPGDQSQDQNLPGKYDRAALRFGYGGVVDVWQKPGLTVKGKGAQKAEAYALTAFDSSPGLFGVYYYPAVDPADGYEFHHYSAHQQRFGLIDCKAAGSGAAALDSKCAEHPIDVVDYRDLQDFAPDPAYAAFSWAVAPKAVDASGRVRRGYLFSSDEFADTGNVPSFTNDAGADAYEQVRFLEQAYEHRYLLDGFRRNRVQFNSWDTTARIQARYLDTIEQIAKTFAFGAVLDGDPANPTADFLADGYYGPLAMSGTVAFDLFARILTRPEPGYYYCLDRSDPNCAGDQPWGVDEAIHVADTAPQPEVYLYDFRVGLGDGRYLHNDFDYSKGYWWSDYQSQVGSYYEKVWATYYLAEAYDFFVSNSKDDFTDSRYKNVNFATVYPEQVRRLYNGLLTGDYASYAPWVVTLPNPSDTPEVTLAYPDWHALEGPAKRPSKAKLADPNYAWNEQIYAMLWGTMYFPTNWSYGFVNEARITALPSEKPDWPEAETVVFHDPESGLTYRAHATGTETVLGAVHQRGAGARMLEWANKLLTVAYVVERDAKGEPVLGPDGAPILVLDTSGKAVKDTDHAGADSVLRKYVTNLDMMRQLTATFLQPLDGGLPQP